MNINNKVAGYKINTQNSVAFLDDTNSLRNKTERKPHWKQF